MNSFLKNNLYFLLPYLVFVVSGAILILISSQAGLHLYFNTFHADVADTFFDYLTFLGDGQTVIVSALILLFVRFRYTLIILLSSGLSTLITQSIKHFVNADRPVRFFEAINIKLYLVPGVHNNIHWSFPSGHSTAAFTLYFCLALFSANKWMKFVFFLLALSVSYSRVYLSQHFFEDIYAGALIGVLCVILIYSLLINVKPNGALDRSLGTTKFR